MELVKPSTYTWPERSVCPPPNSSQPFPPRYVENTRAEPEAFSLATTPWRRSSVIDWMQPPRPGFFVWNAPGVTGKSVEQVVPTRYASPEESTVAPFRKISGPEPPTYVEYTRREPLGSSLVTKKSPLPA